MAKKKVVVKLDKARAEAEAYIANHPKDRDVIEKSIAALTSRTEPLN